MAKVAACSKRLSGWRRVKRNLVVRVPVAVGLVGVCLYGVFQTRDSACLYARRGLTGWLMVQLQLQPAH